MNRWLNEFCFEQIYMYLHELQGIAILVDFQVVVYPNSFL